MARVSKNTRTPFYKKYREKFDLKVILEFSAKYNTILKLNEGILNERGFPIFFSNSIIELSWEHRKK